MKKILLFLFFIYQGCAFGQISSLVAEKQESFSFVADDFIGFDSFGSFYYLKNNVLFKNTPAGVLHYQNIAFGNIKKVDLINPLKVVVFYENFNTAVLLDNQMNEIQKIEFSKNETPIIASALGMAGQNQLWVYNSVTQQIGLYDTNTNQYKDLGVPIKENLIFYQTDFNYFHWIDKQKQWFSCSVFGRVTNNGMIEFDGQWQLLENDQLLYAKNNMLFFTDRKTAKQHKIEIVEKSFEKFYYKDQILSIFTPQGITNYKITLP